MCIVVVGMVLVAGLARDDQGEFARFKQEAVGKVPAGWRAAKTGQGEGSIWKVQADPTGPGKTGFVLAQTAKGPNALFNLCVVDEASLADLELTVAFKALAGENDQGGGLVWRYQDADNYYIARMNPLEDNFRVYKVVAGKRIQLATREGLKVPMNEWHQLQIKHTGNAIECYLDGQKYLESKDDAFSKPGKVGLWTKSDAQTAFDAFRVKAAGK